MKITTNYSQTMTRPIVTQNKPAFTAAKFNLVGFTDKGMPSKVEKGMKDILDKLQKKTKFKKHIKNFQKAFNSAPEGTIIDIKRHGNEDFFIGVRKAELPQQEISQSKEFGEETIKTIPKKEKIKYIRYFVLNPLKADIKYITNDLTTTLERHAKDERLAEGRQKAENIDKIAEKLEG